MSDKYILDKSKVEQVQNASPYENKVWNYINDQNNGVYANTSLSLVQFDLGSIYNQSYFVEVESMYLAIPICMAFSGGTGGAATAFSAQSCASAVLSLKNGGWNILDKAEIELNGQVIEQMNPFLNIITGLKLASQMSPSDLVQFGSMVKFPQLDNTNSMIYTAGAVGMTNNRIFGNSIQSSANTASLNLGCTNDRLSASVRSVVDASSANNFTALLPVPNANQEANFTFSPNGVGVLGNIGQYSDVVIIRLRDILDSFKSMPLCKKIAGNLRLYFNTGTAVYTQANSNTIGPMTAFSLANTTFSTTCPITVNSSANVIFNAATTAITAGLYIGQVPTTSPPTGINLGASGYRNGAFNACRLYYAQCQLKPRLAVEYVASNHDKLITYNTYLTTQIANISAGSSYSSIVQSGLTNIKAVVIVPFISSTVSGFSQWASPADTSPSTFGGPLSLTQLNVQVGGINVLNVPMQYTYDEFYSQISNWENIVSDFGMPVGLITSDFWKACRVYYIDCSRAPLADIQTTRNLVVQFTNNSAVAIDCLVFTIKGDQFTLNVENGYIKR